MSDNQREAGAIVLDPTHASFSPQEGVNDLGGNPFHRHWRRGHERAR
ncbi:MAG: hypothetical protein ACLS6O_00935 [Bifidobacterium sp.]